MIYLLTTHYDIKVILIKPNPTNNLSYQ